MLSATNIQPFIYKSSTPLISHISHLTSSRQIFQLPLIYHTGSKSPLLPLTSPTGISIIITDHYPHSTHKPPPSSSITNNPTSSRSLTSKTSSPIQPGNSFIYFKSTNQKIQTKMPPSAPTPIIPIIPNIPAVEDHTPLPDEQDRGT